MRKLGDVADIHYGKSPSTVLSKDGAFPVVGTGGTYASASKPLFRGPAVLVPRKGSLGNPQYIAGPFWASDTTYAVVPKNGTVAKWLYYSLDSFDLTKLNEATGVPSISRDWLAKTHLGNEDEDTQIRISEILSVIDDAIEKTEALIAKTHQIKSGLMHDLFTRGVTPDGQLRQLRENAPELYQKSSLGWIPREWRVTRCSDVCEKVIDCKNRTPPETPDGFPVIRTPNVRNGEFVDEGLLHTDKNSYRIWTERGKPQPGDIVITREAPVGEVCMIPERHTNACLGQRMMLYRPNESMIDPKYFLYALQSRQIQNRLDLISGGSTVGHVRVGDIRNLWVFVPGSSEEQRQISSSLDAIVEKLREENLQLGKLRAQKLGLMHDLLTGRVAIPAT